MGVEHEIELEHETKKAWKWWVLGKKRSIEWWKS